eukprot:jgi/Chrzof1/1122/Cz01g41020.t1
MAAQPKQSPTRDMSAEETLRQEEERRRARLAVRSARERERYQNDPVYREKVKAKRRMCYWRTQGAADKARYLKSETHLRHEAIRQARVKAAQEQSLGGIKDPPATITT